MAILRLGTLDRIACCWCSQIFDLSSFSVCTCTEHLPSSEWRQWSWPQRKFRSLCIRGILHLPRRWSINRLLRLARLVCKGNKYVWSSNCGLVRSTCANTRPNHQRSTSRYRIACLRTSSALQRSLDMNGRLRRRLQAKCMLLVLRCEVYSVGASSNSYSWNEGVHLLLLGACVARWDMRG